MVKKIIILLSIICSGAHSMESTNLAQYNDLLHSLKKDCPDHVDWNKTAFKANYPLWHKIKSLDTPTKNQLLQEILDSVNDPEYINLRAAIACLICAGADANQTSSYQIDCALNCAAMYQDYEMAELLLKNGANPNQKIKQGHPIFFGWNQKN